MMITKLIKQKKFQLSLKTLKNCQKLKYLQKLILKQPTFLNFKTGNILFIKNYFN